MDWEDAINEAKEELGYYESQYVEDWDEVVEMAKDILDSNRKQEYENKQNEYQEYLKSDRWKRLRGLRLAKSDFLCEGCGDEATQVHHKSYKNLFIPEEFLDLISLCEKCHQKKHNNNL